MEIFCEDGLEKTIRYYKEKYVKHDIINIVIFLEKGYINGKEL